MARIRENKASTWDVIFILFFFVVVAYYLIKWTIKLICIIIVGIAKLVTRISNNIKKSNSN